MTILAVSAAAVAFASMAARSTHSPRSSSPSRTLLVGSSNSSSLLTRMQYSSLAAAAPLFLFFPLFFPLTRTRSLSVILLTSHGGAKPRDLNSVSIGPKANGSRVVVEGAVVAEGAVEGAVVEVAEAAGLAVA